MWQSLAGVAIGAAAFVDVGRVDRRVEPRLLTDVDVGIGARLALPVSLACYESMWRKGYGMAQPPFRLCMTLERSALAWTLLVG